jgi:hypothetical protein
MKRKTAHKFRIELMGIEPVIWRLIEVPSSYSFWDLHVAIQDAMGWLDYHLHVFRIIPKRRRKPVLIGIPDDDFPDDTTRSGRDIPITKYFQAPGDHAIYEYDFGDAWEHHVLLEGINLQEIDAKYPRCLAGGGACPPEDCGGIDGYYRILDILDDPDHPEHQETVEWLKGHLKCYFPFDPEYFNPEAVEFWNPKKRWKMAFEERDY